MEQISSPGNKAVVSLSVILALAICSVAGSYKSKKLVQIRRWEKALSVYSSQLESDNQIVLSQIGLEYK
ncbi:MAG: hypothetical protein J6W46_11245 [Spirochaetaceae bacterium]|nr:hypothetical protein [Spirochaetaceae bacterium]